MFRNKMSIVMYIVISLAIIGLSRQLFTNFTGFLMSLLLMIVIAVIVFKIFSHFAQNRVGGSGGGFQSSPESKKYREAVKRSQEKYGKPNMKVTRNSTNHKQERKKSTRKKRRRPPHLRVIEGKKGKDEEKNDRASF